MAQSLINSYKNAIEWIKKNSLGGVYVSSKQKYPYPEVTGYLIPRLMEAGEHDLAYQYAIFLSKKQNKNGSFCGPDQKEYFFDTAQALKGFLAAQSRWPEFKISAKKAADYLIYSQEKNGRFPSIYKNVPEKVNVYGLPTLNKAGAILVNKKYKIAALKALNYYKNLPEILVFDCLSHFYAYVIDGFIDIGEIKFVKKAVNDLFNLQKNDGAFPAFKNSQWSCSVGTAQFAIIGYKLGLNSRSELALKWLINNQNKSGGFYGSYGFGANYFPHEEISWANKFFLDAIQMKISAFFDDYAQNEFEKIYDHDPRLKKLLDFGGNLQQKKILDAGCGDGRFAVKIFKRFPSAKIYCLDLSKKLLSRVPTGLLKIQGNLCNLGYKTDFFDFVYTIEALEHTLKPENAISELCRVTKENGKIAIIDKNEKLNGVLKTTDFEQWFERKKIVTILNENDISVKSRFINDEVWQRDLFIMWQGIKRKKLDEKSWTKIVHLKTVNNLANKIRANRFPVWIQPLLDNTQTTDSFLELGSGSGELSAILALNNRRSNLLDFSQKNINYSKKLFKILKLKAKYHNQDVLKKFPFKDKSIDWIFSSGLLEHFNDEEIEQIMKESSRIAKKGVITLVPNANAILYQIGKFVMQKNNKWPYGLEIPRHTMKSFFKKAGLRKIKEYSIDPYHSLEFVENKTTFKEFFDSFDKKELQKLNQGYLIFTIGYVSSTNSKN